MAGTSQGQAVAITSGAGFILGGRTFPAVIAFVLAVVAPAEAQTPRLPVDRGVTVTASEGRVVYVDARLVRPGQYWFVVRVTVARDLKVSPDDRVRFPHFTFVAEDGAIYYDYGNRPTPSSMAQIIKGVEPCGGARYLLPGVTITCDLIFSVPSNVTRGTVEIMPPFVPPVPITIRE